MAEPSHTRHASAEHARRAWRRVVHLVWRQMILTEHPAWERFFARRCPHLAGMIAYFGVLSIIPAAFLLFSALALAGALGNQGWVVSQLQYVLPRGAASTIVRTVHSLRANSGSLGVIGTVGLVWSTSNFFSCIESAFNIIYGVNNRHFIFQKVWVLFLMFVAFIVLTVATLAVTVALPLLHYIDWAATSKLHLPITGAGVTVGVTFAAAFLFCLMCYRFLPNAVVHWRDVWKGALVAALGFEMCIHVLPRVVSADRGGVVLSAFAGVFFVLIWFYVMAFILLVGGVYNWWCREKRALAVA